MIAKVMKMRAYERKSVIIISLLAFVFGHITLFLMNFWGDMKMVFPIGSIVAMCTGYMLSGIFGFSMLPQEFNKQIAFGMTRKTFFRMDVIVSLIHNLILSGMIIVMYLIERVMDRIFYATYLEVFSWPKGMELFRIGMIMLLVVPVLLTAIRHLLGACLAKYGNKAIFVIWGTAMLLSLLPNRWMIIVERHKDSMLANWFLKMEGAIGNVSLLAWLMAGIVFAGGSIMISWRILRKQMVIM